MSERRERVPEATAIVDVVAIELRRLEAEGRNDVGRVAGEARLPVDSVASVAFV